MLRLRAIGFCAVLFLVVSCLGGCVRGDSRADEEKDPHFQRGCSLASSLDFKRAADEFQKALESNPRSGSAHLKLGGLYDTELTDYAAAIYHYQQYLQLRPDAKDAARIQDRIRGCKQELANSEFTLPNSKNLQKEVDRLTAENQLLKQQLDAYKNQTATPAATVQYRAEPTRYAPTATGYSTPATPRQAQPQASSHPRVHIVKAHETISSIAAEYGVKASAVLAANPQVDPRRLRIGQSLNLP